MLRGSKSSYEDLEEEDGVDAITMGSGATDFGMSEADSLADFLGVCSVVSGVQWSTSVSPRSHLPVQLARAQGQVLPG